MASKRFVNKKISLPAGSKEVIPDSVTFIEDTLNELGIDRRLVLRTLLTAEEVIARLAAHAEEGGSVSVRIKRFIGDAVIEISSKGDELSLADVSDADITSMEDEEAEIAIRSIILSTAIFRPCVRSILSTGPGPMAYTGYFAQFRRVLLSTIISGKYAPRPAASIHLLTACWLSRTRRSSWRVSSMSILKYLSLTASRLMSMF